MWSFLRKLFARLSSKPQARSIGLDGERVVFEDPARAEEPVSFVWGEVEEIRTFKLDLFTYDTICLSFRVGSDWYQVQEEDEGFLHLMKAMKSRFPSIPEDWYFEVMQPPFATCERVLWRR